MPFIGIDLVIGLIVLLIIGAIVIILLKLLILFIPAIIISVAVWLMTGNALYAGLAFLLVALFGLLRKL